MLQAAIGGTVLRRAVGYPAPLDNGRDLSRFLFLSPVSCLTSATLSLGGLSALGVVLLPDLVTSWVSWWIGDTLGVLVVLPLMFVIAGEPRSLWRSRAGPVALPMLLFFALFVAIFVRVSTWEHDEALLEFRLLSQEIDDKIHAGLAEQEIFLEQLERSFSRPAPLSRADFQHLAKNLLRALSDDPGGQMGAANRFLRSGGFRGGATVPTCRGSKYEKSTLRGNGAVPQSETDTTR